MVGETQEIYSRYVDREREKREKKMERDGRKREVGSLRGLGNDRGVVGLAWAGLSGPDPFWIGCCWVFRAVVGPLGLASLSLHGACCWWMRQAVGLLVGKVLLLLVAARQ